MIYPCKVTDSTGHVIKEYSAQELTNTYWDKVKEEEAIRISGKFLSMKISKSCLDALKTELVWHLYGEQ